MHHKITHKDILFIINPNSGHGNITQLVKHLESFSSQLSYKVTKDLNELSTIFTEQIDTYKVFVIAGGDGSVNEGIKHLIDTPEKILAIFPNGSGNGFARELGFKNNLNSLVKDILRGEVMKVDVLKVNDRYCINAVGIGIDSHVAHAFELSKGRGLFNYIRLSFKSVLNFQPFQAKIVSDDLDIDEEYMMLTIANTRQLGNNAIIAPDAKPNDGKFDLVLFKKPPLYMLPLFATQMFLGTLKPTGGLRFIQTKSQVTISSKKKEVHIDGIPVTIKDQLTIQMLPDKIQLIKTSNNPF